MNGRIIWVNDNEFYLNLVFTQLTFFLGYALSIERLDSLDNLKTLTNDQVSCIILDPTLSPLTQEQIQRGRPGKNELIKILHAYLRTLFPYISIIYMGTRKDAGLVNSVIDENTYFILTQNPVEEAHGLINCLKQLKFI